MVAPIRSSPLAVADLAALADVAGSAGGRGQLGLGATHRAAGAGGSLRRRARLSHADALVADLQPGPRARLLLRIEAGFLDLQIKRDGEMEHVDRQTYLAGDGVIQLSPREVEGETRLDWAVASDRELTFTWRSTTEGDDEGRPRRGLPARALHRRALHAEHLTAQPASER